MKQPIYEIVDKLKKSRTWTEFGVSVKDVLYILNDYIAYKEAPNKAESEIIAELHMKLEEKDMEIAEKDKTIANLRESNKKLRRKAKEGY